MLAVNGAFTLFVWNVSLASRRSAGSPPTGAGPGASSAPGIRAAGAPGQSLRQLGRAALPALLLRHPGDSRGRQARARASQSEPSTGSRSSPARSSIGSRHRDRDSRCASGCARSASTTAELAALDRVFAATEALKQIEQIAFAATQGLYDPEQAGIHLRWSAQSGLCQRADRQPGLQPAAAASVRGHRGTAGAGGPAHGRRAAAARARLQDWIWASSLGLPADGRPDRGGDPDPHPPCAAAGADACAPSPASWPRDATRPASVISTGWRNWRCSGIILDDMARAINADIDQREAVQQELEIGAPARRGGDPGQEPLPRQHEP